MQTLSTQRCILTCLFIAFITVGALVGLDRFGRSSRVFGTTGTIQAHNIVKKQVDTPKDAYQIWKEAGYRGRTVVSISDRWESFDPDELIPAQMFRAFPLQLYNTAKLLEDDSLNGATFLYVASVNRIIRRIAAIVPESEVNRMKEAGRKSKNSRVSDKGVYITRQGFPRWFTTGAKFDGAGEPALLYVGASYFKNAEPEELHRQLSASGLLTDCVILCNETEKETVTQNEIAKLNKFARLIGILTPIAVSDGMTPSKKMIPQHTIPLT